MSFPSNVFSFQCLPTIPATAVLVELQLTKRTVTSAINANLIFMVLCFLLRITFKICKPILSYFKRRLTANIPKIKSDFGNYKLNEIERF